MLSPCFLKQSAPSAPPPSASAIEIADRHTQSIERHGLTPDDLLYGLKPTTRLNEP
jgi:hypothetical protein